jgi:Protein of unknown function (DUF2510)
MNTQLPSQPPPAQPSIIQQTTVIQVGQAKSVALAVVLALLFGPLGMLYGTIPGAIVMFFVNLFVAIPTLGLGLFLTIPIGAIWAGVAASSHNKALGVAAQSVAAPAVQSPPPSGQTPAGWYPEVDGGARQRYWDGQQWTEHIHDPTSPQADVPTQIKAGAKESDDGRLIVTLPPEEPSDG